MSAPVQSDLLPPVAAGQRWEHRTGRTITLRLVTGDAVTGVDEAGWLRSLTRAELAREWRPAPRAVSAPASAAARAIRRRAWAAPGAG